MAMIGNIGTGHGKIKMWAEVPGMPNMAVDVQNYTVRRQTEPTYVLGGDPTERFFSPDHYRKVIFGTVKMPWATYYQLSRHHGFTLVAQYNEYKMSIHDATITDYMASDDSDDVVANFMALGIGTENSPAQNEMAKLNNKELSKLVLTSEY